jgi:ketosteroid isomerase-like protein
MIKNRLDNSENTRKVARQFCQALGNRNLAVLLTLFAENIDWYIPGNERVVPWTGKRTTKQEVKAFFELLWKNTVPVSASIEHILAEDDFAVITGEFSTRMLPGLKVVDSVFSIHLTLKEDLIVKYRLQEDSYAVAAALQSV